MVSQPSPVPRTLCVLPTAPASLNAAALTTTTGTSVSGRSVLKNALWIQDDAKVIILNLYLYRVSSPPSWCLGLLELLQLRCLSCCGSPRDVRSNKAEWRNMPIYVTLPFLLFIFQLESKVFTFYFQTDILKMSSFTDFSLPFNWCALNMCAAHTFKYVQMEYVAFGLFVAGTCEVWGWHSNL